MSDEVDWRREAYFAYWDKRIAFIESLAPTENAHEANVLIWAALDALAFAWSKSGGRTGKSHLRKTFDAFLAEHGPEPFQHVSLPDVWHRIDSGALGDLPKEAAAYLQTAGGRTQPIALTRNRMRIWSEDPTYCELLESTLKECAHADSRTVEDWLCLSRHGAIAYKRMRSAFLHEGRPGLDTHSFKFHESGDAPTYLSGVHGTPAVLGYSYSYMTKVLRNAAASFHRQAREQGIDPVPSE